MRRIKTLLIAAAFVVFGANAFADDATVTFVSGKVEVQRNGQWVALQKGDSVAKNETISTGFQSEAKIKIMDSVMYLGPVTRITLEELSSTGTQDNVNVYLKTGTTRSQVKHVDNKRVNYQVHTAVAVASCRGTDWIADDSNNFEGIEGTVAVSLYVAPEAGGEGDVEGNEEGDETEEVSDTLTTDDGILLKAGQIIAVKETVSAAVNNVIKAANEIANAVSSAASKEAVGGDNTKVAASENDSSANNAFQNSPQDTSEKAKVVVNLEFPD